MDEEQTVWAQAVNNALTSVFAANGWDIRLTEDDDSLSGLPQEMIDEIMEYALLPDMPVPEATTTTTPSIYRINGDSTHFFNGDADARRMIYIYLLPDFNTMIEPDCEIDRAARVRDRQMLKEAKLQKPNRTLDLMLVSKNMCHEVADVIYKSWTFGLHLHQGKGKAGGVEFLRAGRQQLGYATDITDRRFAKFSRDDLYGFCNLKKIEILVFPRRTGDRHLVLNTYYMMQALARLLHRPSEKKKLINKLTIRFGEQINAHEGRPVTQAPAEDKWWDGARSQPRQTSIHEMPDIQLVLRPLAALSHVSNVNIHLPDVFAGHEPTSTFVRELIMHMAGDGVESFGDGNLEWKLESSRDALEAWLEDSSRPEVWDKDMLISEDEFLQRLPAESANTGTAGTSNAGPSSSRPSIFGPFNAGNSGSGPSIAGPSNFARSNTTPPVPGPSANGPSNALRPSDTVSSVAGPSTVGYFRLATTRLSAAGPSNTASGLGYQFGRILGRSQESSPSLPPNTPASAGPVRIVRTGGRFLGMTERLAGVPTTISSAEDTDGFGPTLGGQAIAAYFDEYDRNRARHRGLLLGGQVPAGSVVGTAANERRLGGESRPLDALDTESNSRHVLDGEDLTSTSNALPAVEPSVPGGRLPATRAWDNAWINGAGDSGHVPGDRNRSPPPPLPRAGEATPPRTRLEAFNDEQDTLEGTGRRTLSGLGGDGSWGTAVSTWDIDQERERTDAATAQRGGPVGGRAPPNRPGIAALQRQQRQSLPNRAAAAPRTRSGVSVLQQSPLQQSGSAPPMGEPGHKGKGKGRAKDQSFTIFQDPTEE